MEDLREASRAAESAQPPPYGFTPHHPKGGSVELRDIRPLLGDRRRWLGRGFFPSGECGDPCKLWAHCGDCGGLVYVDLRRDPRPVGTRRVNPSCGGCAR